MAAPDILAGLNGGIPAFNEPRGLPVHIMSVRNITFDWPIRAQNHPKFPRSHMRAARERANDWNVILSADRACIKPVKRHLSGRTDRRFRGRSEDPDKIGLSRETRQNFVD